MSHIKKKVVVVGDGCAGKRSAIMLFTESKFPHQSGYAVWDTYPAELDVDHHRVKLLITKTPGQEDYDRLRPLSYPQTDVALIFFSVAETYNTLENVESKWIIELRQHLPNVPVILVGNKTDLRDSPATGPAGLKDFKEKVTTDMGMKMAKRINALCYLECSALKNQGVQEVFHAAARAAISYDKRLGKKESCVLL